MAALTPEQLGALLHAAEHEHEHYEAPTDVLWPPMLRVDGVSAHLDARSKLRRRFPTASDWVPCYNHDGFTNSAILVFESKADRHAEAFRRALALESECKHDHAGGALAARLLVVEDRDSWRHCKWAKRIMSHVTGTRRMEELYGPGGIGFQIAQDSFEGQLAVEATANAGK